MKTIKKLLVIIGIIAICILIGFIVSILRFYDEIIGLKNGFICQHSQVVKGGGLQHHYQGFESLC